MKGNTITVLLSTLFLSINFAMAQYQIHSTGAFENIRKLTKNQPVFCPVNNNDYVLTFSDEFNGTTLNNGKWLSTFGWHRGLYPSSVNNSIGEIEYYATFGEKPDLFDLSNGTLKIYAKQINEWHNVVDWESPNSLLSDGFPNYRKYYYAAGHLDSYRNFKHGFYEMSCKLPNIDGIWPAFWIFGQEAKTELDIFEFVQTKAAECTGESITTSNNKWYTTYHDWKDAVDNSHRSSVLEIISDNFSWTNNWYRFGVIWDDFRTIWLFEGLPVRTVYHYYNFPSGTPIPGCDQLLLGQHIENINYPIEQGLLSVGMAMNNFGGTYNPPNGSEDGNGTCGSNTATFPANMEIDWIHVYENRSCQQNVLIDCSQFLPSLVSSGKNLTLGNGSCDVAIRNIRQDATLSWGTTEYAHTVYAIANDNILMNPGFRVELGANFKANIGNCAGAVPFEYVGAKINTSETNDTVSAYIRNIKNYVDSIALAKNKTDLGPEDLYFPKQTNLQKEITEIKILPNPNMGSFTIETPISCKKIQLFDALGKLVFETIPVSNVVAVSIDNFASGIYLLRITNDREEIHNNRIYMQK